jgi:hypothetical protein
VRKRFIKEPYFFVIAFLFFIWGCTKLDTTTIGGDLIPEVDNINTFADTLDIISTQGVFDGAFKDTTKLTFAENYVVGKINDPLMGGTAAALYLQMKPPFYPYFPVRLRPPPPPSSLRAVSNCARPSSPFP